MSTKEKNSQAKRIYDKPSKTWFEVTPEQYAEFDRWRTNKIQPSMAQFVEISRLLQVDIKELLEVEF